MILRPGSEGVPSAVFFLGTAFNLLVVLIAESVSASSSSSPNDSLLFANAFFFFLGRPSEDALAGVDALFFVYQWRWSIDSICKDLQTHPSVSSPCDGVAVLELPDGNIPSDLSCASRSFCSKTSARRLRKSERLTRPTVCDLRMSSAEVDCCVNARGVDVRLGGSVEGGIVS